MDFIARICFWVPIVSVAGTDGRSFCWGEDVVGMLSDGWFDFSVGFILGLSSKSYIADLLLIHTFQICASLSDRKVIVINGFGKKLI